MKRTSIHTQPRQPPLAPTQPQSTVPLPTAVPLIGVRFSYDHTKRFLHSQQALTEPQTSNEGDANPVLSSSARVESYGMTYKVEEGTRHPIMAMDQRRRPRPRPTVGLPDGHRPTPPRCGSPLHRVLRTHVSVPETRCAPASMRAGAVRRHWPHQPYPPRGRVVHSAALPPPPPPPNQEGLVVVCPVAWKVPTALVLSRNRTFLKVGHENISFFLDEKEECQVLGRRLRRLARSASAPPDRHCAVLTSAPLSRLSGTVSPPGKVVSDSVNQSVGASAPAPTPTARVFVA